MTKSTYFLFIALTILFTHCKKEENKNFVLKGSVTDARSNAALNNVNILVEQQLLEGGSFGGFFSTAGSATTSGGGSYRVEWDNANIVEARVTGSLAGYITRVYNLSASAFQPGDEISQNLSLYPEANIQVNLSKTGVVPNATQLNFRFENAEFDCLCCNNNWRNITSSVTDSTYECRVYGDTWLKYRYEVVNPGETVFMRDSIFCGRNNLSILNIQW
jgi:hypothetical protein